MISTNQTKTLQGYSLPAHKQSRAHLQQLGSWAYYCILLSDKIVRITLAESGRWD